MTKVLNYVDHEFQILTMCVEVHFKVTGHLFMRKLRCFSLANKI